MLHLKIVSPDGVKFDKEVYESLLPTSEGQIGVFSGHAPLVAKASVGIISVRLKQGDPDDFMENLVCHGGVIEVNDDKITVLADEAERSSDLIEAEEKAAYNRALKLKSEAKDTISLQKAQVQIDLAAVRLNVAKLKRHSH